MRPSSRFSSSPFRRLLASWVGLALSLVGLAGWAAGGTAAAQEVVQVDTGHIERMRAFPSRFVAPRNVDVWLPEDYTPTRRYQVLYMHDGQMLFDAKNTWNGQSWHVDRAVTHLVKAGAIADTIVVAVWNNGDYRHAEYFPQKFLAAMPATQRDGFVAQALKGQPLSDNYLRFLVEELKPEIDRRYATRPERASTFIAGSSMGGLISVYAMNEYPEVFGGAAGLSTHWIGIMKRNTAIPLAAFIYLQAHLADPLHHRLYQDHGSLDLDALYEPYQSFIDEIVRERGYDDDHFMSRVFEGQSHTESAWAARLETPLTFLLRPERSQ